MKTWRVRIRHETLYRYEEPVGFSPHFVRLFPRTESGRLVQRVEFRTNPEASVQYRRDLFDNNFARCFYPEKGTDLHFDLALEVELRETNAFDFLLENYASVFPFAYLPDDLERLAPCLARPGERLLPLPFHPAPAPGGPTVTMLLDLLGAVHAHIRYERRDEGAARLPVETLRLGSGACRDVAVLLAAVLREMGLAARLVSGYLFELETAASDRKAEGAMHMWTEVYLPGAGWLGLDATNGIFCNHNFIATAVGLTSAEITPISGRYFADKHVPATMTARLDLSPIVQ